MQQQNPKNPADVQEARNLRPSDLNQEQDMLLLAGSKVSYREIYAREISLPVAHNKYYNADDVDDLFILMNGMFTDISEQTYRQNKALAQTRKELTTVNGQNTQLKADNENLASQVQELQNKNGDLQTELDNAKTRLHQKAKQDEAHAEDNAEMDQLRVELSNQEASYTRLAQTASEKLTQQQAALKKLNAEKAALAREVIRLRGENSQLNDQLAETTVLKKDYDLVQYQYKSLQENSAKRIAELKNQLAGRK